MKYLCSFFTLTFVLLFSTQASASGNKVGNGGDGVFCKNADHETGQLLDFYENPFKKDIKGSDPYLIAKEIFENLEKVAPKISKPYQKRLSELKEEIEFKSQVSLTDIKDSQHLFQPDSKECKVLQIAIRKAKTLPKEKRFLIRKDLWERLSPVHQAGLLTHEIIYEHLRKLGEPNSIKARKLNNYIYSQDLEAETFWKFIRDLELPIYP